MIIACFTCGKLGHKANVCRSNPLRLGVKGPELKTHAFKSKSEFRNAKRKLKSLFPIPSIVSEVATARGPIVCYTCGKVGHKAQVCQIGPPKLEARAVEFASVAGACCVDKGKMGESFVSQLFPEQRIDFALIDQEPLQKSVVDSGMS